PLHWEYAIELVRQVASGLSAAHACGLVHRDVKPSNILVSRDGRVLLTDFGLSARTTDPAVTAIGTIVGTPAYMSPEQVRGKQVDGRPDIFSLGAVLYELLTGRRPFTGRGSVTGVLSAIVNDPPEPICQGNPSVPAAIEQVVLKALEKKPPQRYQSIDEFREALAEGRKTSGNEFSSMLRGKVIRETKLREPIVPLPRVDIESATRGSAN